MAKKLYSFLHPQARRVQTELTTDSITQPEFARESDINYLVEKHVRAGIPFPTQTLQDFRDVANVPDFQEAQNLVIKARESWYSLDAKVRRHFGDNPENFLEALQDKERHDELVRLKVFKKPAEKPPEGASKGSGGPPATKPEGGAKAPGTTPT